MAGRRIAVVAAATVIALLAVEVGLRLFGPQAMDSPFLSTSEGTADYVAFLEDRGDELRPDAVLVFVGFDDVRRAWLSPL